MATQKIGLTKLGLKKNTNFIPVEWNDQIIEVKEYLPIKDKMALIEKIVNLSLDERNYANIVNININEVLEMTFAYATNINFTEKQKEDRLGLYDLLVSSGLWEKIYIKLCESKEFEYIDTCVHEMINEFYKYRDSILGVLDAVNTDYSNLVLDAEGIQKNLADPKNLTLLKDVVTKLG